MDGEQIVPRSWVLESTAAQVQANGVAEAYEFLWWPTSLDGSLAYMAWGFGGQMIAVLPERELVVVTMTMVDERDALVNKAVGHPVVAEIVETWIAPQFAG